MRKFLPVICGVVVLGLIPSVQAKSTLVRQRDACSMLRVPVAEKLLGGTVAKVERSQGLDGWQVCNAFGKSTAARFVQLAVAPSNASSGSLTAEFCNRYSEAKKVAFWTDSVSWIPKLGLTAFNAAESGLYVYTGSLLFKVYVSAPQPQRSQEVEAEGIATNDAKAAVELARAILQTVPINTRASRPHCQFGKEAQVAVPDLRTALKDPDKDVRIQAVDAIMNLGEVARSAVPDLRTALKDPDKDVRNHAAFALGNTGEAAQVAIPDLRIALKDLEPSVRCLASYALVNMGVAARAAIPDLRTALKDPDKCVRSQAALALGRMGTVAQAAVPALQIALKDPDEFVRSCANAALREIVGK